MKTLVIYDSVYGNTEMIARAIGEALTQTASDAIAQAASDEIPGEVQVLRVGQVEDRELATADLLVVGSPTHGAMPTEAAQDLVGRIGAPTREGAKAATFDTRLTWPFLERWGGFAAPKMAETLAGKGWTLVGEPGGFYVRGLRKGPLKRGEVERAAAWAQGLVGSQHSV